jgi:predicted HAD superfamily Cof-like phosphohydrolase
MQDALAMLWQRLDEEETREYYTALAIEPMSGVAKELADRIYILLGHAVTMGLTNFDAIFAEVHRSNMSKLGADGRPVLRADGKILKGPAYRPPDIAPLVIPRGI